MDSTDPTSYVVGLIGAEIGPSLSPALHEREADELGLRYVYRRIDIGELGVPPRGRGRARARRPDARVQRPQRHPPAQAARGRAPGRAVARRRGPGRGEHGRLRRRPGDRTRHRPARVPAERQARQLGCRTLDGGGMAVFQAALSFALFTGREPDRERMLRHFAALIRGSEVARA